MNTSFLNGILPSSSLFHTHTHTHTHTSDNKPILTPEWLPVNQRCGLASGCGKEVRGRQMEGMTFPSRAPGSAFLLVLRPLFCPSCSFHFYP